MFENRYDETLEEVSIANGCHWNDDNKIRLFARFLQAEADVLTFQRFEDFLERQATEQGDLKEEDYDGPYIAVEWDHSYYGGDYTSAGEIAYIPHKLAQKIGVEKAFEKWTGVHPIHIVCYNMDEEYDSEGNPV